MNSRKKRKHFATIVVITDLVSSSKNLTPDATQKQMALQENINKHKVSIDRTCFQKSQEEKDLLKAMKKSVI